jgi:hypothetical protein
MSRSIWLQRISRGSLDRISNFDVYTLPRSLGSGLLRRRPTRTIGLLFWGSPSRTALDVFLQLVQ